MAYKLKLLEISKVHLVIHVSKLRKVVGDLQNIIGLEVLVYIQEPSSIPCEPKKILDYQRQHTGQTIYHECLVKWKDQPTKASTWECLTTLIDSYPHLVF